MSSYLKSTSVEQTLFLTLLGDPATGILASQVTVQYKKTGQTSFQTFVTNTTNWLELGNGYYTLIFGPNETDTLGTFVYTATGSGFDDQVFEQFNVVDPATAGDQQSYFQDAPCERTVFLSKAGVPATVVVASAVTCKIKKNGQIGFSPKVLDDTNWVNLGNGYYTLRFSANDMSRVGNFVYTLTGSDFDNFAYDEFVVLAAPDTTVEDKCVVSGQIKTLASRGPGMQTRVSVRNVEFPAKSGSSIVSAEEVWTFLDSEGKFSLALLRGATVVISIERAAIRHQIVIPDQETADLMDLLPPFAIDYSL